MTPNIETALVEGTAALRWSSPVGEAREAFWASGLPFCTRKQVAERAGMPPVIPIDQRLQFKFAIGHAVHRHAQLALLRSGFLDPAWTAVTEHGDILEKTLAYRNVRGKPDGFTRCLPEPALVEIKTCDDRAIKYPDFPDHYCWQALWCCLAAGVPQVVILQLGTSQGLARHRVVRLTENWRAMLEDRMTYLESRWEDFQRTGDLPPHEHLFPFEDRTCSFLEPSGGTHAS